MLIRLVGTAGSAFAGLIGTTIIGATLKGVTGEQPLTPANHGAQQRETAMKMLILVIVIGSGAPVMHAVTMRWSQEMTGNR